MHKILTGLVIGLLLLSGAVQGAELEDKKWRKATSANFEIYSRLGERKTITLLRHLEVVRRILSNESGSMGDSPVPTLIVVANSEKEFEQVKGATDAHGVFLNTIRSNFILMREVTGADENHIILHEYTHFLMRNWNSMSYPAWYQEGYAELLGATEVASKRVELFGYNEGRLYTLQVSPWIDAEQLLNPPPFSEFSEEEVLAFYAQSWALVHYLANRDEDAVTTQAGLMRYSELRSEGVDRVNAFEQAFELDVDSLNQRLVAYLESECCVLRRGPVDTFIAGFDPKIVRANPEEVALALGKASEAFNQDEAAAKFFERAATSDETRGPALAGLARLSAVAGDSDGAAARIKEAILAAPGNYEVLLDYAIWCSDQVMDDHTRTGLEGEARLAFDTIEQMGRLTPEYYYARARFEMLANDDYNQGVRLLLKGYKALPSDRNIQTDLAVALVNSGREDAAKGVLKRILGWSYESPRLSEWARELLAELEEEAGG